MPSVALIITTYNRPVALDRVLDSVSRQLSMPEQGRRKVVDDVEAEVLELLRGRTATGTGHPGDDHELPGLLGVHHPSSRISPVAVLICIGPVGPR